MSDVAAPVEQETTVIAPAAPKEDFSTMSIEDLQKIADEEIEKVNQPSEKAQDEACDAIDVSIKELKARLDEIKVEKQMLFEGFRVQKEANKEVVANRKALMDKRNELMAQRDTAKTEFNAMKTELEGIRANLKQSSRVKPSELQDKIHRAEEKIEVESLSMKEEKELRRQIQLWDKELSSAKSTDGMYERREVLEESIKKVKATLDELKGELDAIFSKLGMVSVKREKKEEGEKEEGEKKEDPVEVLNNEWTEVRAKIDEKYTEKKAVRDIFYEQNRKFKNYTYQRKRQNAAKFVIERRQREIEEVELEKKEAEEALKRHPFEKEMKTCDMVIAYLKSLEVKVEKKAEKKEMDVVAPEGMTLLKKKEEEYFSVTSDKKSKKSKKAEKKSEKKLPLVHSLVALESFSSIRIAAPKMAEEVPAIIEAVIARKAFYDTLPRGSDVAAELAKLN